MEKEIKFVVKKDPTGGYTARAVDHSICTQADTLDELKTMVKDAVCCHFCEADKPTAIRLHYKKDEVIRA